MQVTVPSAQVQRASFDGLHERVRQATFASLMPVDPKLATDDRMKGLVGAATDVVIEFLNIIAALTARGPLHSVPAIMAVSVGLPNNPFWRENAAYLTPILVSCEMSVLESVRLITVGAGTSKVGDDPALQAALSGSWLVFITAIAIALHGPKWALDNTLALKQDLLRIFQS